MYIIRIYTCLLLHIRVQIKMKNYFILKIIQFLGKTLICKQARSKLHLSGGYSLNNGCRNALISCVESPFLPSMSMEQWEDISLKVK